MRAFPNNSPSSAAKPAPRAALRSVVIALTAAFTPIGEGQAQAVGTYADAPATYADAGHYGVDHRVEKLRRDLARGKARIAFDVVELASGFHFDEAPIDDNGMPLYGNPFITQGVIYPKGVIGVDENGFSNGAIVEVDEHGNEIARPEFPELVVGTWICRGAVFSADGFNIESGPTVHTEQLFDFHGVAGGHGAISLSTTGLELIDQGVPIARAVTGGTGPYRRARGEMEQTFVGLNASEGFVLRYETRLR